MPTSASPASPGSDTKENVEMEVHQSAAQGYCCLSHYKNEFGLYSKYGGNTDVSRKSSMIQFTC